MLKQFMIQGILKIESSSVKKPNEAAELVEKAIKKALYPEQGEQFTIRRVERLPNA